MFTLMLQHPSMQAPADTIGTKQLINVAATIAWINEVLNMAKASVLPENH